MPGITLTIAGQTNQALMKRIASELTRLTCRVLKKEIDRTAVLIHFQQKDQWFIAGQSLSSDDRNAFRLEVTITEETNTKDEKEAFHKEAFSLLSDEIGNVHSHSSIYIIDCRASSYGYGGVTQERYRFDRMVMRNDC